ncbi:MAG: hypothetical protein IKA28_02170, partial [Tidjanibacter sp.]|nr:hypothetical protein [Tidjanibacter sp.]
SGGVVEIGASAFGAVEKSGRCQPPASRQSWQDAAERAERAERDFNDLKGFKGFKGFKDLKDLKKRRWTKKTQSVRQMQGTQENHLRSLLAQMRRWFIAV